MKKLTVLVLASLGALTLASCGNAQTPPAKDTFTVMFNTHGGSPVATMNDVKVIETSPVTTRDGYDFEGWYLSASYVSSEKVTFPYTLTADIMLHANWTKLSYTVHFDTDGGTPVEDMKTRTITSAPVTTKDGFDFLGWFINVTDTSPISYPFTVTHEMTLHAKWELTTYTVHFDSNGGSTVSDAEHVLTIETAPTTTKDGYDFDGWFTSLESTTPVEFPYEVSSDQTLIAKWTRDTSITLLNGLADEDYWSTGVMATGYTLKANDDYKTEIYMVRNSEGIHIVADQHVKVVKNSGNDWWNHDNIEFRFGSALEHIRPMRNLPQKWISTINGGSSNFAQFKVTEPVFNTETNLYDIHYEILATEEELGLNTYDPIVYTSGISYVDDQWVQGEEWDVGTQDMFLLKTITNNGIVPFTYDYFDDRAVELLDSPITEEWDKDPDHNWKSTVFTATLDGSTSWALVLDMESVTDATKKDNDIGAGIVGEVYSPNWSNGGWTFRKDWCGWGSWHDAGNVYDYNYKDICEHAISDDDWNNRAMPLVRNSQSDIAVKALVSFNANTGKVNANMLYTSRSSTDFEGHHTYVSFQANAGDYRGEMRVSFGYNFSLFTINSAKLIAGNIAK